MVLSDAQRQWACAIFGGLMGVLWAGIFAAIYYGVNYNKYVPESYRLKFAFLGTVLIFVFGIGTFYLTLFWKRIAKKLKETQIPQQNDDQSERR